MTAEYAASSARRKTLGESLDVDETARVAAPADGALAVKGFDRETDHAPLHRDHPRRGPDHRADRRGGEMANIDLGADRDPAGLKMRLDGVDGGHLHFQDHHRRRIDHRHIRDKMPDGALRRHHQGALGADADLDDVACIHGMVLRITPSSRRTPGPIPRDAAWAQGGRRLLNDQRWWLWVPAFAGTTVERLRYFFCAAARSTKVLPPFILWVSGASLIWITTASASTPRFFTSACVMSRIMPAFCSSVRPAAMLSVISGIFGYSLSLVTSLFTNTSLAPTAAILHRRHHPRKRMIQSPVWFNGVTAYWMPAG